MLAKIKLNSIKVVVSKTFIYSNISHDEFALTNNLLKIFKGIKEETENLKT